MALFSSSAAFITWIVQYYLKMKDNLLIHRFRWAFKENKKENSHLFLQRSNQYNWESMSVFLLELIWRKISIGNLLSCCLHCWLIGWMLFRVEGQWSSQGGASFGFSFALVVVAALIYLLDIGIIYIATREQDRNRKTKLLHGLPGKQAGDTMLYWGETTTAQQTLSENFGTVDSTENLIPSL